MKKKKLKVMHLIWSMQMGGAQQVVINYLRDFKDDEDIEFRLYVFCAPTDSIYDVEIREKKYPVYYLNNPKSRVNIPVVRWPFNRAVARKAWYEAIKEFDPDIVHVHISELLSTTIGPIEKAKVPVRFDTLHSNPLRYKGLQLFYNRLSFQKKGVIPICLNNEQAKVAEDYYGFKDYEIVRNGIDIKGDMYPDLSRDMIREELGIAIDTFVVLAVGRLQPVKNYPLLIKSFKKVCQQRKKSLLLIAGDGEKKEELKQLVDQLGLDNKVRFLGFYSETGKLYKSADVMAITSFSESTSLSLLESQQYGLRSVISAGVPDESIVSDKVKKMPENSSEEAWAQAILDEKFVGRQIIDISEYEVHKASERLKDIYLKHWEENCKNAK